MLYETTESLMLKIYYLYMLVDGACTENELTRFHEICDAMEVTDDIKKEVIDYGNSIIDDEESNREGAVIRTINELLSESGMNSYSAYSLNHDKKTQAKVIWTFINLGYSDNEYSKSEKTVVSYFAYTWEVENTIIKEMLDTAETILVLIRQKEWLKTTNKPYDVIHSGIANIDNKIGQLFGNIEIVISEADVA